MRENYTTPENTTSTKYTNSRTDGVYEWALSTSKKTDERKPRPDPYRDGEFEWYGKQTNINAETDRGKGGTARKNLQKGKGGKAEKNKKTREENATKTNTHNA